ncbi:hypothetical protein Xmau_03986 [Xenorhabdus mauleonii]|uniref:Uncharacterized protein n=1 Tax=Xenorhabdus mauleonii TaxID=351675 RepID=A0A1I3TJJ0_9GAMM|nr:hypothetical protein Xmau_03986 [Xenorhabdus mauleonii]SFJ71338.1 hypothetical protein SAMN05421680_11470 [Xenorhabdus mauleonii]
MKIFLCLGLFSNNPNIEDIIIYSNFHNDELYDIEIIVMPVSATYEALIRKNHIA